MRRTPLAIALSAAALLGGAGAVHASYPVIPKVAINPELVNPVVSSLWLQSINAGVFPTPPMVDPTGIVPASSFAVPAGSLSPQTEQALTMVFTTPTFEPPEILIVDVQNLMSVLYVTDPAARAILGPSTAMRELKWLFRQEPSNSAGDAALAGGGAQRMTKVNGATLARKDVDAMVAMLKSAVDRTCTTPAGVSTCSARFVGVDEIGAAFGTEPGRSDADTPGQRLRRAMARLSGIPFLGPGGGSYARRIHFYVAPGVSTSISAGLGPRRTEGADGVERRRDYSEVMAAMSRAGGVWLEMYHYPGRGRPRTPFTAAEWRDVPTNFASFLRAKSPTSRDPLNYLHFVLTETAGSDQPLGDPCRTSPDSGTPNARESSAAPGNWDSISSIQIIPPCPANTPRACVVLRPAGGSTSHALGTPGWTVGPKQNRMISLIQDIAGDTIFDTTVNGPISLVTYSLTTSGMTCQWQRAQAGNVNTRILANGPAAFKVTGTEAAVFGQQFRQFFIVG